MKHLSIHLLAILCVILLFSQCKKEEENEVSPAVKLGEVKLTDSELNLVPYQLNDTITFKDSLGNSQLFTVDMKKLNFSRYHKSGGTDLSTDYYEVQNLTTRLSNNSGNSFSLSLDAPLPSYVSDYHINKNYFIVGYNSDKPIYYSFPCYIDTTDFYYTLAGTSIPYHPSITILNNTYSSIYELTSNSSGKIYYNTTEGIVGFRMEDKKTWYLAN